MGLEMNLFGDDTNKVSELVFGIDLGTTNSAISVVKKNDPIAIKLKSDRYTMPSCVMWTGDDNFVVGIEAYNNREKSNVCYSIKRVMQEPGATFTFELDGKTKTMTAVEISAKILEALVKEVGEAYGKIYEVVVTVPAYFNQIGRDNTNEACTLAGLCPKAIINEPTAASVLYDLGDTNFKQVVVYDLGGGTFDVTLASISKVDKKAEEGLLDFYNLDLDESDRCTNMLVKAISTAGDPMLGGDDIDANLRDQIVFDAGYTNDQLTASSLEKIMLDAERFKKDDVTSSYAYKFRATLVTGEEVEKDIAINANSFAKALSPIYKRTKDILDKVLAMSTDCSEIVLVGGSTKHKMLREMLKRDYPDMKINYAMEPDLSVSLGAALFGKSVKFGDSSVNVSDILNIPIGVNSAGHFEQLLLKDSTLPVSKSITMTTVNDDQTNMHIELYQGTSRVLRKNVNLGTLEIDVPKGKAGTVRVTVNITVTANNMLICTATIYRTEDEFGNVINEEETRELRRSLIGI